MITCKECEAEFTITHDSVSEPEYCPFCAFRVSYDEEDEDIDEKEDWYDDP